LPGTDRFDKVFERRGWGVRWDCWFSSLLVAFPSQGYQPYFRVFDDWQCSALKRDLLRKENSRRPVHGLSGLNSLVSHVRYSATASFVKTSKYGGGSFGPVSSPAHPLVLGPCQPSFPAQRSCTGSGSHPPQMPCPPVHGAGMTVSSV